MKPQHLTTLKANAETLSKRFYKTLGYWPNLDEPKTLQEKILWRKLFEDMSEATRLADKVAVRDYVRELGGEEYLVPALAIAGDARELDFDALPQSFVLKVNNASGANIFVQDRSLLEVDAAKRLLNSLLRLEFGRRYGEGWYAGIQPRVLVEPMLVEGEAGMPPTDYRFHVFHGETGFIEVATGKRFTTQVTAALEPAPGHAYIDKSKGFHTTFTRDWQPAPFHFQGVAQDLSRDLKPPVADEMLALAEKLAGDWGYVRVDLYCIDGHRIYFGELTFAHGTGLFALEPGEYSEVLGRLWDIRQRYTRRRR